MGKFGYLQHVLCHNSAIFEDIYPLEIFYTYSSAIAIKHIACFFENFVFKGKMFRKYKILRIFFIFFGIFKI